MAKQQATLPPALYIRWSKEDIALHKFIEEQAERALRSKNKQAIVMLRFAAAQMKVEKLDG